MAQQQGVRPGATRRFVQYVNLPSSNLRQLLAYNIYTILVGAEPLRAWCSPGASRQRPSLGNITAKGLKFSAAGRTRSKQPFCIFKLRSCRSACKLKKVLIVTEKQASVTTGRTVNPALEISCAHALKIISFKQYSLYSWHTETISWLTLRCGPHWSQAFGY